MDPTPLSPYEDPSWHVAISDIIRRNSTNPLDVRDAVLDGVDLSFAKTILDLGCGFGFMTEAVARRTTTDVPIVGVDACAENERPYLDRITATGRQGHFLCRHIDAQLDWPDGSFDLIVASYAMYFFPNALPEIARILRPRGMFIAVTHSEKFGENLMELTGLERSNSGLLRLIRAFSSENGAALLGPWFQEIERVVYHNMLAFEGRRRGELLTYLKFKGPFLVPDSPAGAELPASLLYAVCSVSLRQGRIVLDKDDAIFRCKRPRCPRSPSTAPSVVRR